LHEAAIKLLESLRATGEFLDVTESCAEAPFVSFYRAVAKELMSEGEVLVPATAIDECLDFVSQLAEEKQYADLGKFIMSLVSHVDTAPLSEQNVRDNIARAEEKLHKAVSGAREYLKATKVCEAAPLIAWFREKANDLLREYEPAWNSCDVLETCLHCVRFLEDRALKRPELPPRAIQLECEHYRKAFRAYSKLPLVHHLDGKVAALVEPARKQEQQDTERTKSVTRGCVIALVSAVIAGVALVVVGAVMGTCSPKKGQLGPEGGTTGAPTPPPRDVGANEVAGQAALEARTEQLRQISVLLSSGPQADRAQAAVQALPALDKALKLRDDEAVRTLRSLAFALARQPKEARREISVARKHDQAGKVWKTTLPVIASLLSADEAAAMLSELQAGMDGLSRFDEVAVQLQESLGDRYTAAGVKDKALSWYMQAAGVDSGTNPEVLPAGIAHKLFRALVANGKDEEAVKLAGTMWPYKPFEDAPLQLCLEVLRAADRAKIDYAPQKWADIILKRDPKCAEAFFIKGKTLVPLVRHKEEGIECLKAARDLGYTLPAEYEAMLAEPLK
jgi:tetratricopeptide (TPR) repeat protein